MVNTLPETAPRSRSLPGMQPTFKGRVIQDSRGHHLASILPYSAGPAQLHCPSSPKGCTLRSPLAHFCLLYRHKGTPR